MRQREWSQPHASAHLKALENTPFVAFASGYFSPPCPLFGKRRNQKLCIFSWEMLSCRAVRLGGLTRFSCFSFPWSRGALLCKCAVWDLRQVCMGGTGPVRSPVTRLDAGGRPGFLEGRPRGLMSQSGHSSTRAG